MSNTSNLNEKNFTPIWLHQSQYLWLNVCKEEEEYDDYEYVRAY